MIRTLFVSATLSVVLSLPALTFAQPKTFPMSAFKYDAWKADDTSDPLSDFPENGLPEAAVIGRNPSFTAGAEAAREIAKMDDNALPMLIAALQKGGFYITDMNGKMLYLPRSGPGLDIAFFDFEVAGMLRSTGFGLGTTLEKLAQKYAGDGSDMPIAEVARRMLVDIRGMRNSKNPHIQFIAGMIFEFNRLAQTDGDLMISPPSAIKLNMIQASLLERLLILDLLTRFEELGGGSAMLLPHFTRPAREEVYFVNASWLQKPALGGCELISDLSSLKKYGKTREKVVKTAQTYRELSKDFSSLDKMKNSQVVKGSSVVNAALAWAKTIMAFMNAKATFDLEQPMPLERTQRSDVSGEQRKVTVAIEMDINKADLVNCVGSALSVVSDYNFSIPKGGPMPGVTVSWDVLLSGRGYEKFTSVPTMVDAENRGDISRQTTDANGKNTIKLTGKPQPEDLRNKPIVPLPKKVDLRVKFALDKMDAKKDIFKVVKLGLGTAIDPASVIEWVADLAMKIPLKSYNVSVPVRDWQPCTDDWAGLIDYKREKKQTIVVKGSRRSNGNSTGDGLRQITEIDNASIQLNPRTREEFAAGIPRKPASIYVHGTKSDIFSGKREGDPCCGPVEGSYTVSFREGEEMRYSKVVEDIFDVSLVAGQRDFSLSLMLRTPMFQTDIRKFLEIDESNCPIDTESAGQELLEGIRSLADRLESGRHGERYIDQTGEILNGSKTVTGPDNSTITWAWKLARCPKR
jgi:hypothetical protein